MQEKIESQIKFLKLIKNDDVRDWIQRLRKYSSQLKTIGREKIKASSSRIYFSEFAKINSNMQEFEGLN